jgi:excisionase family DNA binding protein
MDQPGLALHDDDTDLRLVTLPDAARYLAVSRGALYTLLGTGELASVHIGRARRVPMTELRRFVAERLELDNARRAGRPNTVRS